MQKYLKIWELGYIRNHDDDYLVLTAVVVHNTQEIHRHRWKVPMHHETANICAALMEHYDASQFSYQSMWTLPKLKGIEGLGATLVPPP